MNQAPYVYFRCITSIRILTPFQLEPDIRQLEVDPSISCENAYSNTIAFSGLTVAKGWLKKFSYLYYVFPIQHIHFNISCT